MFKILNLKQFVSSEFCIRCYGCCRFREKESIWLPFSIKPIPYQDQFICPNLDLKTNHCKNYSERPFDCRLYPFLLNKKEDKIFLSVHLNCPFIKKNLKKRSFKGYVEYLKGFLLQKEILDLLKKKPKLICAYPSDEILDLERLGEINRIRR